jgi:hypothetical protein
MDSELTVRVLDPGQAQPDRQDARCVERLGGTMRRINLEDWLVRAAFAWMILISGVLVFLVFFVR